jgi:small subunit ribosomal protein S20
MPIIKSAQKQMRSSARRKTANLKRRKIVRDKLRSANDATGVSAAFKALDKAAQKGTIHQNKANRLKARLTRKVKAAA